MIFRPKCRYKAVAYQFPNFIVNNEQLSFVNSLNTWAIYVRVSLGV